jgi:hypothetical protein
MPADLELALRAHVPSGERIVWLGRPSVGHAVERAASDGWQRAAILGGGYGLLVGAAGAWISGHLAWLAIPALCFAACGVVMRRDHLRRKRLAALFEHTAYALTVHHAVVVRSQPTLELRTVALSDVQPLRKSGPRRGVADLVFKADAGAGAVVFADIEDASAVQQLAMKLKTTPEVMEQQFALVAQWAQLRDRFS